MFNALLISSIYVLDQDKTLDFYDGNLCLEETTDKDTASIDWLRGNDPAIHWHMTGRPLHDLRLDLPEHRRLEVSPLMLRISAEVRNAAGVAAKDKVDSGSRLGHSATADARLR